jgi:CRP/FNR family transcriptional regulator
LPDPATDILRRCGFFGSLDEASYAKLARIAQTRRFERGRIVFAQGDEPPGMYIVIEGLVRIYNLAPSGKEHVLHLADCGQTFGEVAVMGDFPSPAFAEAIEPTRCLILPAGPFRQLLDDDHALCRLILTSMSRWVRHLVNLLEDIVLRDAAGRVARYLVDIHVKQGNVVELPALKKHLASHLNLTSETLSRTLRRLTEAQLIEAGEGQTLHIRDSAGLADIAEGAFPRL